MIIQYIIIALLVATALGYLAVRLRKAFTSKAGCASDCGCAGKEFREASISNK